MSSKRPSRAWPRPRPLLIDGPRADEACQLRRVVERNGLRLEVWVCTDPWLRARQRNDAHRFPKWYAWRWWPGCLSGWYDAKYWFDNYGWEHCFPGRTQYVVYQGGVTLRERRRRRRARQR